MKGQKYMTHEQFEQLLKKQERLGYPEFKKSIIRNMIKLNVNVADANNIVTRPDVWNKIIVDMDWSEHMGAEWWAYELTDRFIHTVSPAQLD